MLDKLLKALVLLVIGTASGLLIWGTNTLTEERIELNRERARLAVFIDMFDIQDDWYDDLDELRALLKTEPIEHSSVIEKTTVYDNEDNIIGFALRGTDTNAFGYVDTIVGVTPDGEIIDVVIADHSNTETYVRPLVENYLKHFKGQMLDAVEFDANTGATATYDSVRKVVEDAVLLIEGDPALSAYQSLFADTERYETHFEFFSAITLYEDFVIDEEVAVYDEANTLIGVAYTSEIDVDDETLTVIIGLNLDDTFAGLAVYGETVPEEADALVEALEEAHGKALSDVSIDGDDALANAVRDAFETVQNLYETSTRVDGVEFIVRTMPYRDGDDQIGLSIIGWSQGFAGMNVLRVDIEDDGTIAQYETLRSVDTENYYEGDNFEAFFGETDIDYDTVADLWGGATDSGDSIYEILRAALDYHAERNGD